MVTWNRKFKGLESTKKKTKYFLQNVLSDSQIRGNSPLANQVPTKCLWNLQIKKVSLVGFATLESINAHDLYKT